MHLQISQASNAQTIFNFALLPWIHKFSVQKEGGSCLFICFPTEKDAKEMPFGHVYLRHCCGLHRWVLWSLMKTSCDCTRLMKSLLFPSLSELVQSLSKTSHHHNLTTSLLHWLLNEAVGKQGLSVFLFKIDFSNCFCFLNGFITEVFLSQCSFDSFYSVLHSNLVSQSKDSRTIFLKKRL